MSAAEALVFLSASTTVTTTVSPERYATSLLVVSVPVAEPGVGVGDGVGDGICAGEGDDIGVGEATGLGMEDGV